MSGANKKAMAQIRGIFLKFYQNPSDALRSARLKRLRLKRLGRSQRTAPYHKNVLPLSESEDSVDREQDLIVLGAGGAGRDRSLGHVERMNARVEP
jgi:hypothetical protein